MSKLKAVSLRRIGAEGEVSFRGESVEDLVTGQKGRVTLLGGPSFYGAAREATAVPLGRFTVPPPEGLTPERAARRVEVGNLLMVLATVDAAPDPMCGDEKP